MTTRPQAVLSVGLSTQRVTGLLPGLGNRRLFYSFGDQIPDLGDFDVTYWVAGGHAVRLQQIGLATDLCSPGAHWLPTLGEALNGRKISSGTIDDMPTTQQPLWVKPAEAKVPALPPGRYTVSQLRAIYTAEGLTADLALQWTASILNLDQEHRFFVLDGKVVTGSPYAVKGVDRRWRQYDAACRFAQHVLTELDSNHPPHFTLDVGLDTDRNRWLVIEGNRSWSSGIYGCDAVAALASITAASHWREQQWQWQPDTQILAGSHELPTLEVLPLDADVPGFAEYKR